MGVIFPILDLDKILLFAVADPFIRHNESIVFSRNNSVYLPFPKYPAAKNQLPRQSFLLSATL